MLPFTRRIAVRLTARRLQMQNALGLSIMVALEAATLVSLSAFIFAVLTWAGILGGAF